MANLGLRDLRVFPELLRDIYKARNMAAFRRAIIAAVPMLIGCETASYNEINVRTGESTLIVEPDRPHFPGYHHMFEQHIREHPLLRHYSKTGDGRALKISDFLSRGQFHALPLYNEVYRRLGLEHQLALPLPGRAPIQFGIALNRFRSDFSERDRLCLDLLRPHLIQAHRNAKVMAQCERELALVTQGVEELRRGVVLLNAKGRVRFMTSGARQRLTELFGEAALRNHRLPDVLERWVREQHARLTSAGVPGPRKPLLIEREGKHLLVRIVPDSELNLLLLEDGTQTLPPAAFESLGVSKREAEVLSWLCQGKSNLDIGTLLTVSVRTVEKHLERIYQKLGVENRTAAVALAQQFLADQAGFNLSEGRNFGQVKATGA